MAFPRFAHEFKAKQFIERKILIMSNQCNNEQGFDEAVCIHTDKVYDSCRE